MRPKIPVGSVLTGDDDGAGGGGGGQLKARGYEVKSDIIVDDDGMYVGTDF